MKMMIDVHCHLTDNVFQDRLDEIINEAKKVGVQAFISSSLGFKDSIKLLELSDYKTIYPSIGLMPYQLEDYEEVVELIEKNSDKIIAIGEVGLDYHPSINVDKNIQEKIFAEFIELARRLNLPLIVHSRSAGKYALQILFKHNAERTIMHAFDGSASHAEEAVKKGYYFSIPPSIARSQQKQKIVKRIPLENLLLESDAPALSPVPGEINKPSNIRISAEWISKLKSLSIDKVEEKTTENAQLIFKIKII
ncbi:MAG: TatD family hydrolase [Thaumarchaeota archaeon]|jgi:TatD DNase family protein|nr:TatD family hydrolase [Candidatus Geocrenenecus arthurdayi]